jgi:hypothetical protein
LVERAIRNSSKTRDTILDPFGGSGTTLIACEKSGRQARLIELEPKYCDVIAQRRIAYLLAVGKMQRLSNCAECGATAYTEAAHFDYERPEEVRWLCRSCHRRWDQADPKGGTERLAA